MTTVVLHWCYIRKTESNEVVFQLILFKSNLYCSHGLNGDQFTECSLLFLKLSFLQHSVSICCCCFHQCLQKRKKKVALL